MNDHIEKNPYTDERQNKLFVKHATVYEDTMLVNFGKPWVFALKLSDGPGIFAPFNIYLNPAINDSINGLQTTKIEKLHDRQLIVVPYTKQNHFLKKTISGVIIKRELSPDNFSSDIDLEMTEVAPINLVFTNELLIVGSCIDGANKKGHYHAYGIPDGCIAHPSAYIREKLGTGLAGSVEGTYITAIEAIGTK